MFNLYNLNIELNHFVLRGLKESKKIMNQVDPGFGESNRF